MSIPFSNVALKSGLIQNIEQACGFPEGGISGNSVLMAQFTGKINIAQDEVMAFALNNSGWNVDDFNHTYDPFITTGIVAGQRDYHFTVDQEGSVILDIQKVMIRLPSNGLYVDLVAVDQQSDVDMQSFYNGQNVQGVPWRYDKTGNGIFLDPIPNYTDSAGLKLFINRESTYFTISDSTKLSGIDSLCHDFLYLKPSYEYARDKSLQNMTTLFRDMQVSWQKINGRYGSRQKDVRPVMTGKRIQYL